ncbi:restriction endonuclease subunit S, partial [Phocaeicola vulgatus]
MSNTWFRLRRGFFLSFFPSDTPHYENVLPDGWCLTDIGELLIN